MKKHALLLALAALSLAPLSLRAEDAPAPEQPAPAKLDVGSPAPEFKPALWIQGDPVTAFKKGETYIIECWATWCGPCVEQIPRLDGLSKKYADKGLVVIGVNVRDDPPEKVVHFVKGKSAVMSYRVAFDGNENGKVDELWLKAAAAEGIPHAFVVRDDKIIWRGHPGKLDEELVGSMVAGSFDAAAYSKKEKAAEAAQEKIQDILGKAREAAENNKFDDALAIIRTLPAETPGFILDQIPFFAASLKVKAGKAKEAAEMIISNAKANPKHFLVLARTASMLLSEKALAERAGEALPFAEAAVALKDMPQAQLLLAQAQYAAGQKTKSAETLAVLVKNESFPEIQAFSKKAVESVKADKPWPEPGE